MPEFDIEVLKNEVITALMTNYEYLTEEAEEAVKDSFASRPDFWHEKADAGDLAKMLASEDDEE